MIFNIQNKNNTYKKISIISKDSLGEISTYGNNPYNPTLVISRKDGLDILNVCLAPMLNGGSGSSNQDTVNTTPYLSSRLKDINGYTVNSIYSSRIQDYAVEIILNSPYDEFAEIEITIDGFIYYINTINNPTLDLNITDLLNNLALADGDQSTIDASIIVTSGNVISPINGHIMDVNEIITLSYSFEYVDDNTYLGAQVIVTHNNSIAGINEVLTYEINGYSENGLSLSRISGDSSINFNKDSELKIQSDSQLHGSVIRTDSLPFAKAFDLENGIVLTNNPITIKFKHIPYSSGHEDIRSLSLYISLNDYKNSNNILIASVFNHKVYIDYVGNVLETIVNQQYPNVPIKIALSKLPDEPVGQTLLYGKFIGYMKPRINTNTFRINAAALPYDNDSIINVRTNDGEAFLWTPKIPTAIWDDAVPNQPYSYYTTNLVFDCYDVSGNLIGSCSNSSFRFRVRG